MIWIRIETSMFRILYRPKVTKMGLLQKFYLLRISSPPCLRPSSAGKLRAVWSCLSPAPGLESLTGRQGSGSQSPLLPVAATRSPRVREAEEKQAWVSFGCPCGPLGPSWPRGLHQTCPPQSGLGSALGRGGWRSASGRGLEGRTYRHQTRGNPGPPTCALLPGNLQLRTQAPRTPQPCRIAPRGKTPILNIY